MRDLSSVIPDIAGATLLPESLARLLVSYISQFMSLQPGDVISTDTPPGVGLGQKPPLYLKPGQTMRLGIAGLGEQRQTTVAA
jgi:2,4-didehydro-3-deoxy-L-rhamnonate hydrolase